MKKSMKDKVAERFKRIQEDRREQQRLRHSPEYQPEQDGFISDKT